MTPRLVKKFLGVHKFRFGKTESEDRVGVTTGLAYTEVGGELLNIEALVTSGKGKVQISSELGTLLQ